MQWWRGSIYEMEFGEFALRHVSQQINFFTFSFVAQMHCIFSRMSRYSMSGRRVLLLPVVAWAVDFDKFLRSGRSPIAHQYQPSFLFRKRSMIDSIFSGCRQACEVLVGEQKLQTYLVLLERGCGWPRLAMAGASASLSRRGRGMQAAGRKAGGQASARNDRLGPPPASSCLSPLALSLPYDERCTSFGRLGVSAAKFATVSERL